MTSPYCQTVRSAVPASHPAASSFTSSDFGGVFTLALGFVGFVVLLSDARRSTFVGLFAAGGLAGFVAFVIAPTLSNVRAKCDSAELGSAAPTLDGE